MEGNASVYQVNPVSRITGEREGGVLKDVGAWVWSKGSEVGRGGEGGEGRDGGRGGRAGNLCVEAINLSRG